MNRARIVFRSGRFGLTVALPLLCLCLWGAASGFRLPAATAESAVELNNLGVGFMNQYAFKEAAAAFRKALAADSGFNLARINLGIALFYDQDLDGSLAAIREAEKTDPANAYINYMLGLLYKNRGESEKALSSFIKVRQADESCASNHYNIGLLLSRLRKDKEAEAELRRALDLDPNHISAMYNLGGLLIKTGRTEEGNRILDQFRSLSQLGGASSGMGSGSQYGEMGEYAMAMDFRAPVPARETEEVRTGAPTPFRNVTDDPALESVRLPGPARPSGFPAVFDALQWNPEFLKRELLPRLGGGVALADLDNNGSVDAVVTRFNPSAGLWQTLILSNDGKGRFTDATNASGIKNSGSQVSASIGDADNDGLPEIYLTGPDGNRYYRNLGRGRFEDATAAAGLGDGGLAVSSTFVDYDHDGDLDLFVCHYADVSSLPPGDRLTFPDSFPGSPNRIFRNNGNGTFTDYTANLKVGGGAFHSIGMIAGDFDNDRDIDLFVLNYDAPPQLFSNLRGDRFADITGTALAGVTGGYLSAAAADLNRDGFMDLVLLPQAGRPNVVLMNDGRGIFKPDVRSPEFARALQESNRFGAGLLDYDNDGDMDFYMLARGEGEPGAVFHVSTDGHFHYGGRLSAQGGSGSAVADFNGDGKLDLLYIDPSGSPRLLMNEQKSAGHWIGVQLEGLSSNRQGFGAKVEIRSGAEYQKFEVGGHGGYLSQDSPTVWFELGKLARVDTITVRWPSGILQSELNVAADRVVKIKELDRKGTSCPLLYTWNGRAFEFITDFLGGCAIGYLESPGRYSIPDTDEYVRIEGNRLVPKDGRYLLNLNNQLEEVIMFDQAQLVAVDHPAGTEIYPDERLMPEPPFPAAKIHTIRSARPPLSAVDQNGRDVLPAVSQLDRIYAEGFRNLKFKGYAEEHALTLDLGPLRERARLHLLLDAWIDYADSTSNLAASQAGLSLIPPYLQVKDRSGQWRTAIQTMGFPAGLPKTMTVDLSGKFVSGDHHIRIVTNMRIFWDRIRVDDSVPEAVEVHRLKPSSADLHFRGYPAWYSPDGNLPKIYDYGRIQASEQWKTHAGAYTRFGDVRELLTSKDDKFVITRHGDEISLAFDARSVPPVPAGWVRDFLLYADGYGKDMDMNSLHADSIGPLPFHAMSKFPYPAGEEYPSDEAHRNYQIEYNTRCYPVGKEALVLHGGLRRGR
jgi:Tfp pilus assembly protein PilF